MKTLKNGFGQVSCEVIRNPEYTLVEKALYAYLSSYANAQDNSLFVSVNKIANELNINQSTVSRLLKRLQLKKIIARNKKKENGVYITVLLK